MYPTNTSFASGPFMLKVSGSGLSIPGAESSQTMRGIWPAFGKSKQSLPARGPYSSDGSCARMCALAQLPAKKVNKSKIKNYLIIVFLPGQTSSLSVMPGNFWTAEYVRSAISACISTRVAKSALSDTSRVMYDDSFSCQRIGSGCHFLAICVIDRSCGIFFRKYVEMGKGF